MMNRIELKAVAQSLFAVEYDRFGVPRAAQGESLGTTPWIELQKRVIARQSEVFAAEGAAVAEECPATPAVSEPITPHHVTPEVQWTELPSVQEEQQQFQKVPSKPSVAVAVPTKPALHPLRGYRLSTKEKVLDALYRLKRVKLGAVVKPNLLAQLLAKHFGADVRIRVINGVAHLLVHKGNDRVCFAL